MSDETTTEEVTSPEAPAAAEAVSEPVAPKAKKAAAPVAADAPAEEEALRVNYPWGWDGRPIDTTTWTDTNWFYPFAPQARNTDITATGWTGVNNAGFVFQTGQYNSRREGYGA